MMRNENPLRIIFSIKSLFRLRLFVTFAAVNSEFRDDNTGKYEQSQGYAKEHQFSCIF